MYKITRDKSANFELFINFARLEYRQYSFLFQFKQIFSFIPVDFRNGKKRKAKGRLLSEYTY